ncbi:MAG: hypothetical protein H6832_09675 [Planctomycetes bacterium]|nr:hypothetical protein [Planctomycetota bacterium]MCB9918660.1 hypothetical protein [Planctomycetota bacterium]
MTDLASTRQPNRIRLEIAMSLLAALICSCDASLTGISRCATVEDIPFGLYVTVADPTRLPALDLELHWNVYEPTSQVLGVLSFGTSAEDAVRDRRTEAIFAGRTSTTVTPESGPFFAKVRLDGGDECSGGSSPLFAIDTRTRLLWVSARDGGSELVVFDLDGVRPERRFALDALPEDVTFVDAGNGLHAWVAHAAGDGATWILENVDLTSGDRTTRLATRSDVPPRLHTTPGGRELVVASWRADAWHLQLLLPNRAEPYELGTSNAGRGALSIAAVDPAGRAVVWTEASTTVPDTSSFVIAALGPLGPTSLRRIAAGARIADFSISRDGKRFAWISTTSTGTRASLGIATLEPARTLYFVPSPAEGQDIHAFHWSPAGDEIVAIGDIRANERDELMIVRGDGRLLFPSSGAPNRTTHITPGSWSPDGSRFAWIETSEVGTRLLATELLGLVTRQMSESGRDVVDLAWSTDGRELVWRRREGSGHELVRALPDGSVRETVRIGETIANVGAYAFDPTSSRLAFVADSSVWTSRFAGNPQRESPVDEHVTTAAWTRFYGTAVSR